ncbi:BON domain-containing protein [Tsuneonella sp. HG222]
MADRYQPNRNRFRDRDRAPDHEGDRWRQEEQFRSSSDYAPSGYDPSYGQMGESGPSHFQDDNRLESTWDRNERYGSGRGYSRGRDDRFGQSAQASSYRQDYGQPANRFSSFTSEDQAGRDFSAPTGRWDAASTGAARPSYGGGSSRGSYRADSGFSSPQYSDRPRQRDWWDRTTDEIASWFGDEDAERRRENDHRGRGPSDYTRSDDRIREDVNDNLTNDWAVDARKVRVKVENSEVTLEGTVPTRLQKRRAEDCAEDVSGVTHVQNNLRVGADETGGTDYASGTATDTYKTKS